MVRVRYSEEAAGKVLLSFSEVRSLGFFFLHGLDGDKISPMERRSLRGAKESEPDSFLQSRRGIMLTLALKQNSRHFDDVMPRASPAARSQLDPARPTLTALWCKSRGESYLLSLSW